MHNRIGAPRYIGEPVDLAAHGICYGFRSDPMEWINTDPGPVAAGIRKLTFRQTLEGDADLVAANLADLLARQEIADAIAAPPGPQMLFTVGWWVLNLLDLGCPLDHPRIVAAAAAMGDQLDALDGRAPEDPEKEGMMPFRALCLLGMADHPTMRAWGRQLLDRMAARLTECHQWTHDMERRAEIADPAERPPTRKAPGWPYGFAMELNTLWVARDAMDVTDILTDGINWIADNFDGPGRVPGMAFDEAWSMAMIPADNGHPDAGRIALRLIPHLLRMQDADGGWGHHSAIAFRALVRQGLLGPLATLPPLPPDWRTVRSIPAPGESPFNIAWDGERLWVHDMAAGSASGISSTDGEVLRTIQLPERRGCVAFGAWDGSLWVLPGDPADDEKTLFGVSPVTGETLDEIHLKFPVSHYAAIARVSGKVLISDQREGGYWVLGADGNGTYHSDVKDVRLACPMPDFMSASGDDVWTLSRVWFDGIMRTNAQRELLDWGETPFGHAGIAHDGQNLWALDPENKRICLIEKTESGRAVGREVTRSDDTQRRKRTVGQYFSELASPGFGLEEPFFLHMGRRLAEFADIPMQGQVLDVAAGRGASLFPAAAGVGPSGRAVGIDLAEEMVRETTREIQKLRLQNAQMREMDAEQLDFEDATFDRVLCGFALFFLPHLDRALLEVSRVLKPGGVFAVSSFASDGYPWRWYEELLSAHHVSSRFDDLVDLLATNLSTSEAHEEALRSAGFDDIQIVAEAHDEIFGDREEWWQRVQSSADGALLDGLDPEALREFRDDAFERLQALRSEDGIRVRYRALLSRGTKLAS